MIELLMCLHKLVTDYGRILQLLPCIRLSIHSDEMVRSVYMNVQFSNSENSLQACKLMPLFHGDECA